jgi:hypothetical protein
MKKRERDEAMKDFLARGGKVTIIPPSNPEDASHVLPMKTQLNYDVLSLGDGEFYFGETRTRKSSVIKKKITNDDFSKMVESSTLPSGVIEALKLSIKDKK